MSDQQLQFVAVTAGGRAFDITFPLHPETRSPEAVSDLVSALLATISARTGADGELSDGDILQALAMTSAIRGRMVGAGADQVAGLHHGLFDTAWAAVCAARGYAAARA